MPVYLPNLLGSSSRLRDKPMTSRIIREVLKKKDAKKCTLMHFFASFLFLVDLSRPLQHTTPLSLGEG